MVQGVDDHDDVIKCWQNSVNILRGNKKYTVFWFEYWSHVNGCVKMFILSFCQMSSSAKHKPEILCSR